MLLRLTSPLTGLLLLVGLYTVNGVLLGYFGETPSPGTDIIFTIGFSLFLTWWVYLDRRSRSYPAPFEFEAFVFFAWPIVVPFYLIQTRRWRGLPLIGTLYLALFLPNLVIFGVYGFLRLYEL